MFQVQATGRQRFAYDGKKLGTFATFLGKIFATFFKLLGMLFTSISLTFRPVGHYLQYKHFYREYVLEKKHCNLC